ncbi:multidrug effflux MFS transporter [Pseudocolwellia agarivorans]|uniref:multidrug effflux MFS transporter n=1 Tax=Pseudocolwellia agarivorans TaxID=1911682 RepID=UPI00098703E6|nr:multidrug effflux MFS transporter [Pseudocolwellia agarivorans]
MFIHYQKHTLPFKEFVGLMALVMSLVALSIDSILPALGAIGDSMGNKDPNDNQLMVGFLFIGLALGQFLFGPLSDSIGRRKSMLIGYSIFFIGSLLAIIARDYDTMLFSRFLQGFGVSVARVLSTAIVRDLYSGRRMAKVMSFIMMIFILVPMLAPIIGQSILTLFNWQAIFIFTGLVGLISLFWYLIRQGETLAVADRTDFTWLRVKQSFHIIFTDRKIIGYVVASGFITGPFVFFLGSSQQLLQFSYALGEYFPLYFAGIAFVLGIASFVNGKHVVKHGMLKIASISLSLLAVSSIVFFVTSLFFDGLPPLWITTIYLLILFFCLGLTFGNLTALSMEPLGNMAGMGAAIVGSVSTLMSVLIAIVIGQFFDGTTYVLTLSFLAASVTILLLFKWINSVQAVITKKDLAV